MFKVLLNYPGSSPARVALFSQIILKFLPNIRIEGQDNSGFVTSNHRLIPFMFTLCACGVTQIARQLLSVKPFFRWVREVFPSKGVRLFPSQDKAPVWQSQSKGLFVPRGPHALRTRGPL